MKPTLRWGCPPGICIRSRIHGHKHTYAYDTRKLCLCARQAAYGRRKKNDGKLSRRESSRCYRPIVQTCVHQRAAYRLPLTCLPPPGHIVKYGSWRCTTPHLENYPQPPLALLAAFQRCLARHACIRSLVRKEYCDLRICL